jgi:hypothetical protein
MEGRLGAMMTVIEFYHYEGGMSMEEFARKNKKLQDKIYAECGGEPVEPGMGKKKLAREKSKKRKA